jgi:hypothetical protein
MELKHKKEIKDSLSVERETEKRDRWYNKLWDVTAKIGKTMAKTLCIVTVPVIVASCTCSRIELEGDAHSRPDIADVSHEDAPDVHDAVEDDIIEDDAQAQCEVEDIPEMEIPAPCENLTERYQINNLIGDYLNRRVDDRIPNEVGNTDAEYTFETAETSENANPFSDGEGGSIGPTETFMHRITGDVFSPLEESMVVDNDAAKTYIEEQDIWIRGSSYYDDSLDDVVGDMRFVAYTMKFKGESDNLGIPVCTESVGGDYTYCRSGVEDASYDYATESHKVRLRFLGSEWLVTEMSPPVVSVTNEIKVQNGGYVKLGKERMGGIVNKDETLTVDCLWFRLDDIEEHDGRRAAIISVVDEYGNVLKRDKVFPGQTKEFNIDGGIYRLHVWKVAPGYEFGAVWADMSILSDEIKVEDGQHLDPDYERFRGWEAVVGWKNKDAAAIHANIQPDHLRTIGIYADDIADISSNGDVKLLKGDGFNFPYAELSLCYDGLEDVERVRIALSVVSEPMNFTEVIHPEAPDIYVDCELNSPLIRVVSEEYLAQSLDGLLDREAYVAVSGGSCGEYGITNGSVIMKRSPASSVYAITLLNLYSITLLFSSGDMYIGYGFMGWERGDRWYPDAMPQPEFIFQVLETPCRSSLCVMDYLTIPYRDGSLNFDVINSSTGDYISRRGSVIYAWSGPVREMYSGSFEEPGFITETGSRVGTISETEIVFESAKDVAYSVYYIGAREE